MRANQPAVVEQLHEPSHCEEVTEAVSLEYATHRFAEAVGERQLAGSVRMEDLPPTAGARDWRRDRRHREPSGGPASRALDVGSADEQVQAFSPSHPVPGG